MEKRTEGARKRHDVSRRGFLKRSALAGLTLGVAGAGLTGCSSDAEIKTVGFKAPNVSAAGYQYPAELTEGTWYHNACQRNCFDTCMIKSKVVGGRLVEVRGDEKSPFTAGGLCVKTQSYVDWTYHADRILYPLRRTGTKGEGCTFERISWEDAITEITDKWKEIIQTYGGEAITWSRYQGNQGSVMRRCLEPLFFKMGATYCDASMCNNSYVNSLPYTTAGVPVMATQDIAKKDLYVAWGHNPCATSMHTVKYIKECHKNGGKIVVIDPCVNPQVMWATLYIQLKPGSDVALAMGVANYLIEHDMYDQSFIDTYSIGFEDYLANVKEWSLSKTAETCGVPEEQISQLAEMLWEYRTSLCLKTGLQIGRRRNGGMTHIGVKCLSGLIGHPECYYNMTSSGGLQEWSNATPAMTSMLQGKAPSEADYAGTIRNYSSPELGKMLNGQNFGDGHDFSKVPIKSLMVFGNNPMVSHPNRNLVQKGLEREDLFTIVHEMFWTPSCDYADIVLPAPGSFEYEEFNGAYGHNYAVYNAKAIEELGESMNNWELCNRLGRAMGYTDEAFNRDETWFENKYLANKSYTMDELKEMGWYYVAPKTWDSIWTDGFPTTSKKFQFACDQLEHDHGVRTLTYTPDPESLATTDTALIKKYPLALLSHSAKEYLNGCFGNMEDNNILFDESYVFLNSKDAEDRGIKDGDEVILFNDRGEVNRKAKIDDGRCATSTILAYKSTWDSHNDRPNINQLTTDERADIGRGVAFMSCLVDVKLATA